MPGGDADRGREVIEAFGCGACHSIAGVEGAAGRVGPDLRGLAKRNNIAGRLPNTPENLVRWIAEPQQVDPGNLMPDLGADDAVARDMAAYLYER